MSLECVRCGASDHQPDHSYCGLCGTPLPEERGDTAVEELERGKFVGRKAELREGLRALGSARRGRGGLVEIRGEAGIGKTRLAGELLGRNSTDFVVRSTRCRVARGLVPYGPWLDLLRTWPQSAPGATQAAHVAENLTAPNAPRAGDRTALARSLAEFLRGAEEDARDASGALILVFDDLHVADPSSLFTLRHLAADRSLVTLFVVTTRPDLPRDWHGDARIVRLELEPLRDSDRLMLARTLLAPLPDRGRLAETVAERASGNPLHIEHTCRAILEGSRELRVAVRAEGILHRTDTRLARPLEAIVADRIARLPNEELRVLQIAAIVESPVDKGFLARLAADPGGSVDEPLSRLERRRLLIVMSADAGRFEITDEYTAAAVLDAISAEQRAALHRSYADHLAGAREAHTPERAALIGHHYDRAGVPDLAAAHLLAAGRGFMNVFAPEEATALLRRSWELFNLLRGNWRGIDGQTSPRASAGLALAAALNSLDQTQEAAAVLSELQPTELGAGDEPSAGATYIHTGWTRFSGARNPSVAREFIERGLALTDGKPGADLHAGMARAFLARIEAADGNTARALEHAEALLHAATAAGSTAAQAIGSIYAADALCNAGRLAQAWRDARYAIGIVEASGSEIATTLVFVLAAKVHVFRGDPDSALRAAARGRTAAEASGDQGGALSQAAVWSGAAHLLRGVPLEAMRCFEEVAQHDPDAPASLTWLACGHLELGNFAEARDLAERCLCEDPPRLARIRTLRTLSLARARESVGDRQANLEQAKQHADETIELADRLGLRPHGAWGRLALAEIMLRQGRREEAERLVAEAVRTLRDCGMQPSAHGFLDRIGV